MRTKKKQTPLKKTRVSFVMTQTTQLYQCGWKLVILKLVELQNQVKIWLNSRDGSEIVAPTNLFRPPLTRKERSADDCVNLPSLKRHRVTAEKFCTICRSHGEMNCDHKSGKKCPWHPDNIARRNANPPQLNPST